MRENFIDTITIAAQPFICRFVLHPAEQIYIITVLNRKEIKPFQMAITEASQWKIIGSVGEQMKAVEDVLSNCIAANNGDTSSRSETKQPSRDSIDPASGRDSRFTAIWSGRRSYNNAVKSLVY